MLKNRLFIGLCGGISENGREDNSLLTSVAEDKFGFFKTSPLTCMISFAKATKILNDDMSKEEKLRTINNVCISGRKINENIWMNMALNAVPPDKRLILIDDVYFLKDAMFVKKFGGVIFKFVLSQKSSIKQEFEPDVTIFGKSEEEIKSSFVDQISKIIDDSVKNKCI